MKKYFFISSLWIFLQTLLKNIFKKNIKKAENKLLKIEEKRKAGKGARASTSIQYISYIVIEGKRSEIEKNYGKNFFC